MSQRVCYYLKAVYEAIFAFYENRAHKKDQRADDTGSR